MALVKTLSKISLNAMSEAIANAIEARNSNVDAVPEAIRSGIENGIVGGKKDKATINELSGSFAPLKQSKRQVIGARTSVLRMGDFAFGNSAATRANSRIQNRRPSVPLMSVNAIPRQWSGSVLMSNHRLYS